MDELVIWWDKLAFVRTNKHFVRTNWLFVFVRRKIRLSDLAMMLMKGDLWPSHPSPLNDKLLYTHVILTKINFIPYLIYFALKFNSQNRSQFCMSIMGWSHIVLVLWVSDSQKLNVNTNDCLFNKQYESISFISSNLASKIIDTTSKLVVIICSF